MKTLEINGSTAIFAANSATDTYGNSGESITGIEVVLDCPH